MHRSAPHVTSRDVPLWSLSYTVMPEVLRNKNEYLQKPCSGPRSVSFPRRHEGAVQFEFIHVCTPLQSRRQRVGVYFIPTSPRMLSE